MTMITLNIYINLKSHDQYIELPGDVGVNTFSEIFQWIEWIFN